MARWRSARRVRARTATLSRFHHEAGGWAGALVFVGIWAGGCAALRCGARLGAVMCSGLFYALLFLLCDVKENVV